MARQIEVLANTAAIVDYALQTILKLYAATLQERPFFSLVAAGGSTPKPLYEALAQQPLDWSKFHVFWGDERYVPVTDPQSNEGMARKAWLDQVAIPGANVHPMHTSAADPAVAAQEYEDHLRAFFPDAAFPAFDVVLLGMGDDGHTASLFPGTTALGVTDRWVTVGQKDSQPRITLTYPAINSARQVIFLVSGANKTPALNAVFAEEGDANIYPSRLIDGNVLWLIDEAAKGQA